MDLGCMMVWKTYTNDLGVAGTWSNSNIKFCTRLHAKQRRFFWYGPWLCTIRITTPIRQYASKWCVSWPMPVFGCLLKEPGTEFSTMSGLARLRTFGSWIYVSKRKYQSNDHCITGDTKLSTTMNDICVSASYFLLWLIHASSYYFCSNATWPWQTQNCHKHIARLLHDDATSFRLKLCTEPWKANPRKKKTEKIHGWVDPSIRSIKNMWQWFDNWAWKLGKGYDKTWRSFQAFNMQEPKPNHGQLLLSR